jgi:hypothetical protein
MNQPAPISLGRPERPPVSPPPEEGELELRTASGAAQPPRPPLEAELVQQGRLSMGQLAQAHRDRLEKGGSVLDIVVERGWVSAEDVAELKARQAAEEAAAAAVPPPPPRIPETTTAPEPAPAVAPPPQPETPAAYRVAVRLSNGELITAGEATGVDGAEALAQVVVADVATADGESWPYVSGRYIRPESVVSVDILPAE